uniref:Lipoprotein signal peptidase n=1 Tax=Candidatus Aschnera chinzeii TaxID=1485666 RepID=A0AAT9G5E4_9ENTR|nr:MAG: signal peptidase II [Candidatus Aschnera chinzeii]
MKKNIFLTGITWLWLSITIIIIDYYSKKFICNNFALYDSLFLTSYLNITYVQNFGAAFNILSELDDIWKYGLFSIVTIIICSILIKMLYNHHINKNILNIAYSLIIGGGIGNLYDRLIHGFVIDFIDFHFNNWHLATFNIADIAISIGIACILIEQFII